MKNKLIAAILLFVFAGVCWAAIDQIAGQDISGLDQIAGQTLSGLDQVAGLDLPSGGGNCTASTPGNDNDEIGYMTIGGTNAAHTGNRFYCWLYQAGCSDSLNDAYIYARSATGDRYQKILVASTTDTNPSTAPTNGTVIGYTAEITTDTSEGWDSGAMSGGSVTSGNYYWVCIATPNSASISNFYYDAGGPDRHYVTSAGDYDTLPATLPISADCVDVDDPYGCCTGSGAGCSWTTTADRNTSLFVGIGN
jgi:hypothetical protein